MAESNGKKYAYYDGGVFRSNILPETDKTPEVHYTYLPLSIASSAMYDGKINTAAIVKDCSALATIQCEMLQQCLVSWDLRKLLPDGSEALIDCKNLEELKKIDDYVISEIFDEIRRTPKVQITQLKN